MENRKKSSLKVYLQQPFPDRSKPKMKGEENSISEYYDMFSSDYSIDDFFVVKFKSVGKGRQMTSAVVHSNRIEGVKEDKSVELEVKKFLITFNITLKSASNLNDNLNCSKELEHYAS